MKSYQPAKAPVDFTKNVMGKLQQEEISKKTTYQPIFGKWFLRLMAAAFTLFVGYSIFGGSSNPEGDSNIFGSVIKKLPQTDLGAFYQFKLQLSAFFGGIPSVVYFTLIAATLLLLADILFLKRSRQTLAS